MQILTPQNAIQQVIEHQRAGRLTEAEALCRQVLTFQCPQDPAVNHLLGLLNCQLGRYDVAVDLIRRAVALNPRNAEYHGSLGMALLAIGRAELAIQACIQALSLQPQYPEAINTLGNAYVATGQWEQAIARYRYVIALRPNIPEAHNNLGNALRKRAPLEEILACYREAIRIRPGYADAHYNLGTALHEAGRLDDAIASLRQALALQPAFAEAHLGLANALLDHRQTDEAIASYRQALALRPKHADTHANLGAALTAKNLFDQAMACYRQALALDPAHVSSNNNIGLAHQAEGRIDEAIASYQRALASRPNNPESLTHLGSALQEAGRLEEAINSHRQAIAADPECAQAHLNLAFLLLAQGQFREGWPEYEWRRRLKYSQVLRRDLSVPQWRGEELAGRRILIHAEQGFGDVIQYVRYVPLVAQRGGAVVLEVQPELRRLFESIPGVEQFVTAGEPLPAYDLHCPMPSLPLAFDTTLETIPASAAYLHADPLLAKPLQKKLAKTRRLLNVGLAWAGKPTHRNDRQRSIALGLLSPLGKVRGTRFFSLQKGEAAEQALDASVRLKFSPWAGELNDFADTAALISNLDLVITVDTAIAHLAGAMGKPVWIMLPFRADHRWLLGRDDSPWYPTARLFRQTASRQWEPVVKQIRQALALRQKTSK